MTALVLGHKNPDTDSIVSALSATYLYRARGIDAVSGAQGDPSPETAFVLKRFGLKAPEVVHSVEGREVYLVDYSDLAQAPDDFPKCRLLGIIDHHKLGDVTSDYPLECWIQPVGCSNTIVKLMYDYYKVEVPKDIAGAMLCAILSDTVLFRSPTCTPTDIRAAKELAAIAGVDNIEALGIDFDMNGKKVGIGQLSLISLDLITPELKAQLAAELKEVKAEGRDTVLLVLTDIMKEGSELLMESDDADIVRGALKPDANGWMAGVMSRKKQVVPPLQLAFKA